MPTKSYIYFRRWSLPWTKKQVFSIFMNLVLDVFVPCVRRSYTHHRAAVTTTTTTATTPTTSCVYFFFNFITQNFAAHFVLQIIIIIRIIIKHFNWATKTFPCKRTHARRRRILQREEKNNETEMKSNRNAIIFGSSGNERTKRHSNRHFNFKWFDYIHRATEKTSCREYLSVLKCSQSQTPTSTPSVCIQNTSS